MKNIIFIQRVSLWLLVGVISSWLLGCSPKSNNSDQIEFWTMQLKPNFTKYFLDLNTTFEAQNEPIKLRWVDVPWSAMENKILTSISARTAPDLVNLNPKFASQLATKNVWLSLNEVVTPEIKQTYLPKIWQASTIEVCQENNCQDQTFGIPWYLTTNITIYNQKLLSAGGIEKAPQTYKQLAIVAQQIKAKTGKYALFISFVPGDSEDVLESFVKMGVNLTDESGQAAFDTPKGKAAFQYWVDLYQRKLLPPEVLTQGHRYGIEQYQAGEVALLNSGAEFMETITNNAPSIAKVSQIAPQITGKTGKKNVAVMNLVIPRNSENSDQALKYALHLTNTENQLAFAKASNTLPSTVAGVEKYIDEIKQQKQLTLSEKAKQVSATQLNDAEILIPVQQDIQVLQRAIYENLQAAMLKEKTVEQAVQDAASQWNSRVLKKN